MKYRPQVKIGVCNVWHNANVKTVLYKTHHKRCFYVRKADFWVSIPSLHVFMYKKKSKYKIDIYILNSKQSGYTKDLCRTAKLMVMSVKWHLHITHYMIYCKYKNICCNWVFNWHSRLFITQNHLARCCYNLNKSTNPINSRKALQSQLGNQTLTETSWEKSKNMTIRKILQFCSLPFF